MDPENIRCEYSALTAYHNTVVSFRFTVLGFYLAAVGLIVGSGLSKPKAGLVLGLSFVLWLVELRNRSLLGNLGIRGMQIERDLWGYKGDKAYDPFFCHMIKEKPKNDPQAKEPPHDKTKIMVWRVRCFVSPTIALDLLLLVVSVFSLVAYFSG